ncbi:MAG: UDP-N-acetylmuramate dehydrogenase [Gammaproteobacteria bacterium]|nr:UDP-N-acetylmuramate dehydrogenase [Gammaproteobacteria bacterium]
MHTRDGHDTRHGADWFRDVTVRGTRREREGMARHCSWRAGGAADRWFEPADLDDLIVFMHALPAAEPLLWLGLGSNLLVRDGGLRGTVISTGGGLAGLQWHAARTLHAGCGAPCAKVAKRVAAAGLGGGEFLAGIPGTIGGALAMNAGAFGGEIWPLVVAVDTIDRAGTLRRRTPDDYRVSYRHVVGPADEWFVAAELRFAADADAGAVNRIRELLAQRNRTQPLGLPSGGSTFKNPPGDFAGRLIEAVGLKGARRGGAGVSTKHANFIINDGTASAADIEALIDEIRARVLATAGIRLEHEVRIVGEAPA